MGHASMPSSSCSSVGAVDMFLEAHDATALRRRLQSTYQHHGWPARTSRSPQPRQLPSPTILWDQMIGLPPVTATVAPET
jgi:hypothetical protein